MGRPRCWSRVRIPFLLPNCLFRGEGDFDMKAIESAHPRDLKQKDPKSRIAGVLIFDHPITRSLVCTEVRRNDHPIRNPALKFRYQWLTFLLLFLTQSVFAADTGTLHGTVTDPLGAVIQNANVALLHNGKQISSTTPARIENFNLTPLRQNSTWWNFPPHSLPLST